MAGNNNEWKERMGRTNDNPEMRKRMQAAARQQLVLDAAQPKRVAHTHTEQRTRNLCGELPSEPTRFVESDNGASGQARAACQTAMVV